MSSAIVARTSSTRAPHADVGRRRYLGVALALLVLATPALTPAQVAEGSWLVWIETERGETTFEIAAAGSRVEVVAQVPGIHLGLDGERVEIRRNEVRAPAWRCDPDERPDPTREVRAFELVLARGGAVTSLDAAPEMTGNEDIDDALDVVATIGPYAVVRRRLWIHFVCGAHAYGGTHYAWLDLRSGATIDALGEAPATPAVLVPAAARFLRALVADGTLRPGDLDGLEESERESREIDPFLDPLRRPPPTTPAWIRRAEIHVTDLVPRWSEGRWRARHRLEHWIGDCCESPDALTDRATPLPARFTPHAIAPPVVQRFLRRYPRVSRLGFSRAP